MVLQILYISACVVLSLQATANEGISPRTTANLGHYNVHCFSGTLAQDQLFKNRRDIRMICCHLMNFSKLFEYS